MNITPKQKAELHAILLDAKNNIVLGQLFSQNLGGPCTGICVYVATHSKNLNRTDLGKALHYLNKISPYKLGLLNYVAPVYDFNHVRRIGLLDWLIENTKP